MNILLDTHSFFWILTNDSKLSASARASFEKAEKIFIPTIVLLELLYLLDKKRMSRQFVSIFRALQKDARYVIVSLDTATVATVAKVSRMLEMHDRIIIATAQLLRVPIITRDKIIRKVYKNTIW